MIVEAKQLKRGMIIYSTYAKICLTVQGVYHRTCDDVLLVYFMEDDRPMGFINHERTFPVIGQSTILT
jgi:hypothetical protein